MVEAATLKRCSKCGEEKPATAEFFYRDKTRRDGLHGPCKSCDEARMREWRHTPAAAAKNRRRSYAQHHSTAQAAHIREFYGRGCVVCGGIFSAAMAAHHREPSEKEREIRATLPMEALLTELGKCVPVCFNHHQQLHLEMGNGCASWPLEDIIAKLKREHQAWVMEQASAIVRA